MNYQPDSCAAPDHRLELLDAKLDFSLHYFFSRNALMMKKVVKTGDDFGLWGMGLKKDDLPSLMENIDAVFGTEYSKANK